jgi:putative selenium metabolism hydrolase
MTPTLPDHAATDLLQALVRAPSPSGRERPAVVALSAAMRDLDFDEVRIDDAGNAIGILRRGAGPTLVLNGHIDTVPTGDRDRWPVDPLAAEIVDGHLWGRGSVDMKGALAAMVIGARQAADDGIAGTVVVAAMVQEEVGGLGARWFGERTEADLVILGEPSDLEIKLGHRGRIELTVELPGKIAHAAKAHLGENALLRAARYALALEALDLPHDPFLGTSSATLTQLRGYPVDGANVVPGRAELTIDYRNVAGDDPEQVRARLQSLDAEARISVRDEVARSEDGAVERRYPRINPAYLSDPHHPAVAWVERTLAEVSGRSTPIGSWWFATDAPFLARIGAPVIGYGPGNPELAHTTREALPLGSLLEAVRGYRRLTTRFLQGALPWPEEAT